MKTRLQVSGQHGSRDYKSLGIGGTVRVIAKEEGAAAFWKGIGPAWAREASYTSLRLGLYGPLKTVFGVTKDSNFMVKFAVGSLAGAIGSIAGNPFDVLKTRLMTSEGKAAPSFGRAASELYAHRGVSGFYRGLEVRRCAALGRGRGRGSGRGRGVALAASRARVVRPRQLPHTCPTTTPAHPHRPHRPRRPTSCVQWC